MARVREERRFLDTCNAGRKGRFTPDAIRGLHRQGSASGGGGRTSQKLFWIYDFGLRERSSGIFSPDALGFAFGFSARSPATNLEIERKPARKRISLGSN